MNVADSVLVAMQRTSDIFCSEFVSQQNVNSLDRVYTSNARILPPGAEMIEGREQIKSFWQQAVASLGVKSAALTTVDAESGGDYLFEIGRADLTLRGGQPATVKYVVLWRQEGGTWKWHVDIWNPNA